jgi:hypothetical protein
MAENKVPNKPAQPEYDAGHVPITEEFDSAKRSLPPVAPVVIALVVVGIVVAAIAFAFRAKPVAQGGIDAVYVSTQPGQPSIFVPIQVTLRNVSGKTLYIKDIKADVKTDQGEQSDTAAASSDYERYFAAFPDLKEHSTEALVVETKIAPGGEKKGTVLVSFPLTKEQFDARKDLTVTVQPYDQNAVVLREKTAIK